MPSRPPMNTGPRPAQFPQDPHPRLHARRGPVRVRPSDAGAILKPRGALLLISAPPPLCRGPGDTHLGSHMRDRTARTDALHHDQPTRRCQTGISVRHARPPWSRGNLDTSNSTPEVSPMSTTIRVSTPSACLLTCRCRSGRPVVVWRRHVLSDPRWERIASWMRPAVFPASGSCAGFMPPAGVVSGRLAGVVGRGRHGRAG